MYTCLWHGRCSPLTCPRAAGQPYRRPTHRRACHQSVRLFRLVFSRGGSSGQQGEETGAQLGFLHRHLWERLAVRLMSSVFQLDRCVAFYLYCFGIEGKINKKFEVKFIIYKLIKFL